MKLRLLALLLLVVLMFAETSSVQAQTYLFSLDTEVVNVFWNSDGSVALDYVFVFTNSPNADPIDFVDVVMPNDYYDWNSISADVNGNPVGISSGLLRQRLRLRRGPGQSGHCSRRDRTGTRVRRAGDEHALPLRRTARYVCQRSIFTNLVWVRVRHRQYESDRCFPPAARSPARGAFLLPGKGRLALRDRACCGL
jgi:hypothetical protein